MAYSSTIAKKDQPEKSGLSNNKQPFFRPVVQPKLTINQPNDEYEQEADAVADKVMRMPDPSTESNFFFKSAFTSIQRKCAHCEEEDRQMQRTEINSENATVDNELDTYVGRLSGGGRSLPEEVRSFFEPRMGYDFSNVKVHTDAVAAKSARSINALAYTSGNNVVFGNGQYSPDTDSGRRLLGHELTHVVQASNNVNKFSAERIIRRRCGLAQIGTVSGCTDGQAIPEGPRYLFRVNCDEFSTGNELDLRADAQNIQNGEIVEIHGLASAEGNSDFNRSLSCARALRAQQVIEDVLRQRGITASIQVFNHGPVPGTAYLQRSIVVTHRTVTPPVPPRTPLTCPPPAGTTASTLLDYIDLIRCAETRTTLSRRDLLAVLRQIYYGKPWSVTSTTPLWDRVITCHTNPGNPQAMLGTELFQALGNSVNVQGTDVGHIFTGLESMLCPINSVQIDDTFIVSGIMDDIANVSMGNEDFATWGGDLGATAAAMVACWDMNDTERAGSEDCGHQRMPMGLPFYFTTIQANDEDLEGDIISFVMRANSNGIPCAGSIGQRLSLSVPISVLFENYLNSTAATGHVNRYRCFAELIGATLSGNTITNRSSIVSRFEPAVEDFAVTYYVKIMADARGRIPPHRIVPFGDSIIRLGSHSASAINMFLSWLERKMATP